MSVDKAIAKHKELLTQSSLINFDDVRIAWENTGGRMVISLINTDNEELAESIAIMDCDREPLYAVRKGFYLGDAILVEDLPALMITHEYLLQELGK